MKADLKALNEDSLRTQQQYKAEFNRVKMQQEREKKKTFDLQVGEKKIQKENDDLVFRNRVA